MSLLVNAASLLALYAAIGLPLTLAYSYGLEGRKRPFLARLAVVTLIPWAIQSIIVVGIEGLRPGTFSGFTIIGTLFASWLLPLIIFAIICLSHKK